MRFILAILIAMTTASGRAETPVSWARDDGSLTLVRGEEIIWRFNFANDLSKPYFHPLNLPGGRTLTWESPPDHPWHYGLWFSWKFINGVNYWEENRESGLSDGRTTWGDVVVTPHADGSARIEFDLKYQVPEQAVVLTEHRVIDVSSPRDDGGYTIGWDAKFTAQAEQVTLDRTPLPGQPNGEIFGGYAGLSMRLSKAAAEFHATCSEQAIDDQPERMRFRAAAVDYSGSIDGTAGGVTIIDEPENVNSPTPWYIIRNTKTPMTFFSPTVIQDGPMTLARGDSFQLRYQIVIHSGKSQVPDSSHLPHTTSSPNPVTPDSDPVGEKP